MGTIAVGPSADLYISSNSPTNNTGARTYWFMTSPYPALLRFDLSGVAATNSAASATLEFYKSSGPGANADRTITAYSIAAANGDWIEGTKDNALAGSGEPCWNAKAADGSGGVTTAWAGSAGLATAGTDYENTALGTVTVNAVDAESTKYTLTFNAAGLARLSGWFGASNTNYGLLLLIDGANANYHTKESTQASAYKPILTVNYEAAAAPIRHRLSLLGVGR